MDDNRLGRVFAGTRRKTASFLDSALDVAPGSQPHPDPDLLRLRAADPGHPVAGLTRPGSDPYRRGLCCGVRGSMRRFDVRTAGRTLRPAASTPPVRQRDTADFGATTVSKRTFQPNNRRRAKTHGFRLRMRTRAGRAIVAARRRKGRRELSA